MITAEETKELYNKTNETADFVAAQIAQIERYIINRAKKGYNSVVIKHAFSFNGKTIKQLKENDYECRIESDNLYIFW